MTDEQIESKAKQYWDAIKNMEKERNKQFGSEAIAASYERTAARLESELERAGIDPNDYRV